MSALSTAVSLHPYFQIQPGKVQEFTENFPAFIERTSTEAGCLYYDFTLSGDVAFCREAYIDGEAALNHLANVDDLLKKALSISSLLRLEIHGPESELSKMRGPLAGLNPTWFAHEGGLEK